MTASRYRLRDDGYPFRWIVRGRDRVGRVVRNADGSFTGIWPVQAPGRSWEDALDQVVAVVEGVDVSDLTNELVQVKPVQERTQAILAWLIDHAEANDGLLTFTNTDLARAAGWPPPNQALGNLVSRLDLCCAKTGLPSIGCAAAKTFKDAWSRPIQNASDAWCFPVELMQRRAKSHRWTREDFERIGRESRALLIGSAHHAWDDFIIKHEAAVQSWAHR